MWKRAIWCQSLHQNIVLNMFISSSLAANLNYFEIICQTSAQENFTSEQVHGKDFLFFLCPNFLSVCHLTCAASCTCVCLCVCVLMCLCEFDTVSVCCVWAVHPGPIRVPNDQFT